MQAESSLDSAKADRHALQRVLSVVDLTALGIAAIIGAGAFSTIGNAAYFGGPAVALLFIFTAVACAFAALCYGEFAATLPIAGSAYTYAYAAFGELVAWIIGWDLIMEYSIGNIAEAISWSDYLTTLLASYGVHIPDYLTMDFLTAWRGYDQVTALLTAGNTFEQIQAMPGLSAAMTGYRAWTGAPVIGVFHLVCDLPALAIVLIITTLIFIGIQESKRAANFIVAIKLGVILMVIGVGIFYINPQNWRPFAPNGLHGVLHGVSAVFFAYIGFDAISTTAEECKNPQRDLPRGIIYSLIISTVLFVLIALVITGLVHYQQLAVGDPLAFVFGASGLNMPWASGIIAISALLVLGGVLLVFQLGQSRIWMAMSRDGLLPPLFAAVHSRFKTPWFSTLISGLIVAIPSLFMNLTEVTDLTSIGTLFAFMLVSGGVLVIGQHEQQSVERRFKVPYINSKYIAPFLFILIWIGFILFAPESLLRFFSLYDPANTMLGVWDVVKPKIPLAIYISSAFLLVILCFKKELSLIPVLSLLTCGYLMTELGITNWLRFLVWLVVGLCLYFCYGYRRSKLATHTM